MFLVRLRIAMSYVHSLALPHSVYTPVIHGEETGLHFITEFFILELRDFCFYFFSLPVLIGLRYLCGLKAFRSIRSSRSREIIF
jgi:hypothetical protein